MKNIHCDPLCDKLVFPPKSFKNKSKCDIAVTCHLFCKKKECYGRSIVVCYFNSYTYNQSCVIKSKQNLLYESKCMFQTHSKNMMDIKH